MPLSDKRSIEATSEKLVIKVVTLTYFVPYEFIILYFIFVYMLCWKVSGRGGSYKKSNKYM
jgi:cytochrome bd-type quinol oxidase subunit 2